MKVRYLDLPYRVAAVDRSHVRTELPSSVVFRTPRERAAGWRFQFDRHTCGLVFCLTENSINLASMSM